MVRTDETVADEPDGFAVTEVREVFTANNPQDALWKIAQYVGTDGPDGREGSREFGWRYRGMRYSMTLDVTRV